jgi:hypothetical protein
MVEISDVDLASLCVTDTQDADSALSEPQVRR